ncbi:MAG TPA: cyclic nucleotide-binding domain-containing protein [Thermoanaerobaculaceae bacterium]|nr:cyclic nucleotide-binding domain-containing protein [Thermoanaerobaculaceae bacterium]
MFRGKPRFEQLDEYLLRREYDMALEAMADEIKKRPENFNLLLRQAEILGMAGDREKAIGVYRKLARHYAQQGFYARAIAVTNKILRLDATRQDVTRELAAFIAAQQEAEKMTQAKLKSAEKDGHETLRRLAPAAASPATTPMSPPAQPPPPPPPHPDSSEQQAEKERAASRFFVEFPPGGLEQLLYAAAVRSFDPPEVIVREGQPGTSFFLIEDGVVEVRTKDPSGKPLVLAQLTAGEFFGEVSVLTGKPRTATIAARTPVTVIEISKKDLDRIAQQFPEVRTVLQRFYERRAQATVEAMLARIRGADA